MGINPSFKSAINSSYNYQTSACGSGSSCLDKFGCPQGICPDFSIRRHDTKPALRVSVEDCSGPLDLKGLVLEVNMWAKARLKKAIVASDTYISLADDIGFEQIMVGDIIVLDRVRLPEYMLVIGFDENNKLIQVQRGYQNTESSSWKKGTSIKILRIMNAPAQTEMVYQDVVDVDGTTTEDVLQESYFIYEWQPEDTCLPGCYYLEFKLMKMLGVTLYVDDLEWTGPVHTDEDGIYYTGSVFSDASVKVSYDFYNNKYYLQNNLWNGPYTIISDVYYTGSVYNDGSVLLQKTGNAIEEPVFQTLSTTSIIPSFTDPDLTTKDFYCNIGVGVEWVRRFPINAEGFLIKIFDSPTKELI